ncbi:MAG TPA: PQQ-binding-like beta-propeller repeat protein [Verrucomicrobiota bacterium]|nr:PQQ-binding-like beta-propeller repeat protein [Verrucomicrobiota bacterium]
MSLIGKFKNLYLFGLIFLVFVANAILIKNCFGASDEENWQQWRGPNNNGSITKGIYPVKWNTTNLLWKVTLPGKGSSTPIVWNHRIYLTSPSNKLDSLLVYDWDGKPFWHKVFGQAQPHKGSYSSSSNPSPITDGKAVFVLFNSGNLAAVELDGKIRWQTNLVSAFGPYSLYWDPGTSPVLTENDVIVARMHHGDSWVAAFNKNTGALHWKTPRNFKTPEENDNVYTTPLVIKEQGREAIAVWGAYHLTTYAATDGKLLWICDAFNPNNIEHNPSASSPILAGGFLIVPCALGNQAKGHLEAVKLGGSGDVTSTHRVWRSEDIDSSVPTPAEYNGRIYVLGDHGKVWCFDPATGKTFWSQSLPKTGANYYFASPLIAAGKLYAAKEDGVVFVAEVGEKFTVLAENRMEEQIIASPIAVDSRLFIRGAKHLFCIDGKK